MRNILIIIFISIQLFSNQFSHINNYFEKNALIMILIDPSNGQIIKANQSASKFYGYPISSLEKMSIKQINTFTKTQVQEEMQNAKKENRNYFIFRHKLFSGELKRVEVYSRPILYNNKRVLFSIIQDVTNLELAQKEIEKYSKTLEEQVDLKSKELINEEKNLKNLFLFGFVLQLLIIIFLYKAIKKRQKAESELETSLEQVKASEEQMKDIINSFPIPIIRAEPNFVNIDFFNKAFHTLFRWDLEDINTIEKWEKCAYPDVQYREDIFEEWETLIQETNDKGLCTSAKPMQVKVTCKNGEVKLCQLWYHNNNNNIYGIFYDITKQTKLEEENLEQQKMILTQAKIAAVGEMLGNIAHQWRQPLSIISTQVSGMKVSAEFGQKLTNEAIYECSDSVVKQVNYLSSTIDDFKSFFTSDSESIKEFNLKDMLEKLYGLVKDTLDNNYIEAKLEKEDVVVSYNENKLIQCLLNICNNSKDAMVLNHLPSDDRYFFASVSKDEENAIIKIKDSGGGISEDALDKIFEPYFTTKHASIGTGIGLYMTYQLVTTSFNGTITAQNIDYEYANKPLRGAEFTIKFPLKNENI